MKLKRRKALAGELINRAIDAGVEFYYDPRQQMLWWRWEALGVADWTSVLQPWMAAFEPEVRELMMEHGAEARRVRAGENGRGG